MRWSVFKKKSQTQGNKYCATYSPHQALRRSTEIGNKALQTVGNRHERQIPADLQQDERRTQNKQLILNIPQAAIDILRNKSDIEKYCFGIGSLHQESLKKRATQAPFQPGLTGFVMRLCTKR